MRGGRLILITAVMWSKVPAILLVNAAQIEQSTFAGLKPGGLQEAEISMVILGPGPLGAVLHRILPRKLKKALGRRQARHWLMAVGISI